jgi:hypothetical protein
VATGRRRGNDGGEKLSNNGAQASEEGRVRWGRCGDLRGRGGQFIGPEEGAPRQ